MSRPHDPALSGKLKEYVFAAWIRPRNSQDDSSLAPGETRPADHVLQIHGLRLQVAIRAGRAVIVDDSGIPVPILDFLEQARREGRRVYAILISTIED